MGSFDDYKKRVQPGRRVAVNLPSGERFNGVAANLISEASIDPAIRLDNGWLMRVSPQNYHLVELVQAS